MQLCEAGLVDLDAPATTYLRAYPLVGNPRWRPVTVRHLLTHTSGIPDVIHLADLLHPGWGSFGSRPAAASVPSGAAIPPLAEVYRSGLRSVVEPGTTFAYTNHGVATLGQIVEDVTGTSLDRYLEDRVFRPLGMLATHLGPAGTGDEPRAVGYEIGSRGPTPAPEREWVTLGASGAVSTTRDMGRFVAALIGGGANEHGSVLQPATLATMFAPQFRSDPRVPGIGLAFFRSELGGHRVVGHDGRLPGFNAQLVVAPDDGVGVVAFTNGSRGATSWLPLEMEGLLRDLLGVRSEAPRTDIAARPEVWPEICGRYALPQRIGDFRGRMLMGGGVEILVQDGRLMARLRVPAPALWRGLPLLPVKASDPYLFRLDLAPFGMPSTLVAFTPEALHTDLACLTLVKRAAKAGSRRREQRALSGPRAHPEADRLTADDRLILSVDAAWPQDVGALAILDGQRLLAADGSLRIDAVREAIGARLHLVPRFRQRVVTPRRRLGGPLWVDAPAFDLADHVREHRLPPGSGEAELLAAVEERRRQRLDRRRPLWEMWLLPGLEGGRVGLFMRMHHVIGDGRAAMTIVAAFLDRLADPSPAPAAPWRPGHRPSARALRRDHLERRLRGLGAGISVLRHPVALVRRLFGMLPEMRELLAEKPGADTSLNRVIGPSRRLALIRASAIDLRHVARLHGATVNDVLLTVIAAGLRAVLAARGERTDGVTMRVFVPVSLRGRLRGTVEGNRVSQMAVPLRLDIADPARRLRWVADETAARKRRARTTLEPLFRIGLVRRLMLAAIIRQRVNVTTASLTGPRQPLYLAGARVLELFPFVNLIGNQPLGVGALSYAGALEIGVVADADAYPDLDVFAAAVGAELARLVRLPADASVAARQVAARVPARAAG